MNNMPLPNRLFLKQLSFNLFTLTSISTIGFSRRAKRGMAQENSAETEEEVLVTGIRSALRQNADMKRDATSIIDAITATDIGKLPDNNVAEALQRVPGIQIGRTEGGEGASIQIRGLSENRTEINGRTVLPNSAENRSNSVAAIPANMISRVEVAKSAEAKDVEGSLGGTVRIYTYEPLDLDGPTVSFIVNGGYDALLEDDIDFTGSIFAGGNWDIGDSRLGALINVSLEEYDQRTESI